MNETYYKSVYEIIKKANLNEFPPSYVSKLVDKYIECPEEERNHLYTEEEQACFVILSHLSIFPDKRYQIIFTAMTDRTEDQQEENNIYSKTNKIKCLIEIIEKLGISHRKEKEIYHILTKHTKITKMDNTKETETLVNDYQYTLNWLKEFNKKDGIDIISYVLTIIQDEKRIENLNKSMSETDEKENEREIIWNFGKKEGHFLAKKEIYEKMLEDKDEFSIQELNDIVSILRQIEETLDVLNEEKVKYLSPHER